MARGARGARSIGLTAIVACLVATSIVAPWPAAAGPNPAQVGQWSAQVPLGIIGIHAALLPTGDVLFYEGPGTLPLGRGRLFDTETLATTEVNPPFEWSPFCSGMSMLPDGRLFATGGEPPRVNFPLGTGVRNAAFFDPAMGAWAAAPSMQFDRWYPSNVQMPDGTVLVVGGQANPTSTGKIRRVESYDPGTNTWTTFPSSADAVAIYPRLFLMPNGNVFRAGPSSQTHEFHPGPKTWSFVDGMSYGTRNAGGTVLLPGLDRVLTSGGIAPNKAVTNSSEIIDLSESDPQWRFTGAMNSARMHHNLVLLPDGNVLAVGGGRTGNHGDPVKMAELYDPDTGRWTNMVAQAGQRTYHSTALLLPDGRVLSAGANSKKPEQTTVEFYSPPYLFKGERPVISSAPSVVGYRDALDISTIQAADISGVVLMRAGSVTHGVNFDQRSVELGFTKGPGVLHATTPASPNLAPPGYYLLFIMNSNGVPSVAEFVRVD